MASNQERAQEFVEHIEGAVRDLNDQDYIETLEEVSSSLDSSVQAKREELRLAEDDDGS